jgi:high affinity Mn2+ porin
VSSATRARWVLIRRAAFLSTLALTLRASPARARDAFGDADPGPADAGIADAPPASALLETTPAIPGSGEQAPQVPPSPPAPEATQTAPQGPAPGIEHWRANFQSTYLWQDHPAFSAPYDGPHSLVHTSESSYSLSATLYLGFRPWRGTEIFANPEIIQSEELSDLHGLGGLSNGENQKSASPKAKLYSARAFVRQTFNLGGERTQVAAGPNQFAREIAGRRLVVTLGQMALVDIFDNNAFAQDARTQLMNWSFLTHAASDYAADARGYTWGIAVELYFDDWAFRFGRFAQPKESNGLPIDFKLWQHYGDNLEIEHRHSLGGRPGKLRILGVHNYARMGAFDDAVAFGLQHGATPDLATVRRDQSKFAFGLALEQVLTADLGVFGRFSWNDGRTETYAFMEVDRSLTAGAVMRGRLWHRPDDTVGLGLAQNEISDARRRYLANGGLGVFIGDGQLSNYTPERIAEAYYAFAPTAGLWASVGYQLIGNPAYNADRGPVSVFSIRLHIAY